MRHLEFIPPHFDPPTTPDEQPDLPNLPLPAPSTPTPAPIHSDRHPLNRLRQRKDQYNEESSSSSNNSSNNNFG
eukprot:CAMPEP_0172388858 /NCGR_PEP_ID=MMETSP1061-20121228/5878_1 /TAXON_ID=37318 /ORGANISM="Pseudo-nitzschia pungens, Strain cf. pungens" /LENGTH=73 /DNA_ID=CAMNT_0013118863 /DNA_START=25 /DNA_END=243 /DNA_ORIENTATION=+